MSKYVCMITDHHLSQKVLRAFADGSGAGMAPIGAETSGIPVYYGILRGCGEAIKRNLAEGRPFLYVDHGYFGRSRHEIGDYGGHYRIVKDGLYPKIPVERPISEFGEMRFMNTGLVIEGWRTQPEDSPVLISPPSPPVAGFYGIDVQKWLDQFAGYNAIVTEKAKRNFWPNLLSSKMFISHSSQGALESLLRGIPALCTSERSPISQDLNGAQGDRLSLFCWLAERQWTLSEMESWNCPEAFS